MASKRKKIDGWDIDMTPMIDVTFQLITFFMFTMNFTEAEQDQRIQLPTSQVAKPVENSDIDPLTLQLMEDGRVIYNGEPVALLALGGLSRERKGLDALGEQGALRGNGGSSGGRAGEDRGSSADHPQLPGEGLR